MSVYIIAQITINDRARYGEYEAGFMEIFERYDGELMAVEESPEVLEGAWDCTRTVLIRFPSRNGAEAWYASDAYQALARHRHAASTGNVVLVNGFGSP